MITLYLSVSLFIIILFILYLIIKFTGLKNSLLPKVLLPFILLLVFLEAQIIYHNYNLKSITQTETKYMNSIYNKYLYHWSSSVIPNDFTNFSKIFEKTLYFPATFNNSVDILQNGDNTYNSLFNELKNAKHHIHIEDFMMKDDATSKTCQDILINKAKEGVKVRLIFDGIGSHLEKSSIKKLKTAGIEVIVKSSLIRSLLNGTINNRDHRKIFIIDGQVAYTGGINLGDEYLGKDLRRGFWRDIDIRLSGDSVKELQSIFLSNWFILTGQNITENDYYPPSNTDQNEIVQIVSGAPSSTFGNIELLYTGMINMAQKSIYITSPYITLDNTLYTSLASACMRGVDVKIIIPSKPDESIAYKTTLYYAKKLAQLGVGIYTYQNGYIHSKTIISDDRLACIGTSNLNNRSMHQDYENCVLIYGGNNTKLLYNSFLEDIKNCAPLNIDYLTENKLSSRIFEKIAVFLSPIE